jgi:prophage regulatory protein
MVLSHRFLEHMTKEPMPLPASGYVQQTQLIGDRTKGIAGNITFSASTLWRKVSSGEFPSPVRLSANVSA